MIRSPHQYAINLFRTDYTAIGQVPVEVDWTPAIEWASLCGLRKGDLAPGEARTNWEATPAWNPQTGPPFVKDVRVSVTGSEGGRFSCNLKATDYLKSAASWASSICVEEGRIQKDEVFWYAVSATPKPGVHDPAQSRKLRLEESDQGFTLAGGCLADLAESSEPVTPLDNRDLPLFVPQEVLDESADLARRAGEAETGGVLIGFLHRDPQTHELFVQVTAQIPARQARGELTRLVFTPESWTPIRAAIQLRRRGEIMLGWWHSHSYLKKICRDCQKRRDGTCQARAQATASFFSGDDCDFHLRCFPRAFSVALVVADSPCSGLTWAFFGWREGSIQARSYQVTRCESPHPSIALTSGVSQGDPTHAS
jgi:proteasome lid subunit RPN8/RPN11